MRDGGDANLVFGFAEYADGEADRTFRTQEQPNQGRTKGYIKPIKCLCSKATKYGCGHANQCIGFRLLTKLFDGLAVCPIPRNNTGAQKNGGKISKEEKCM